MLSRQDTPSIFWCGSDGVSYAGVGYDGIGYDGVGYTGIGYAGISYAGVGYDGFGYDEIGMLLFFVSFFFGTPTLPPQTYLLSLHQPYGAQKTIRSSALLKAGLIAAVLFWLLFKPVLKFEFAGSRSYNRREL